MQSIRILFSYIALILSTTFLATPAISAGPKIIPQEESPFSANITVTSNWIFRGLTQTNDKAAIQGGIDYQHESGFYAGNWNSSISSVSEDGVSVSVPMEVDLFVGFKKDLIGKGFESDLGFAQYLFPSSGSGPNNVSLNSGEVYFAQNFTFGPMTGLGKFSYAVSNLFGFANSVGSNYSELNINFDTGFYGIILNTHAGFQRIVGQQYEPGEASYSYTDWMVGLSKDFGYGLTGSIAYVGTNVKPGSGAFANTYAYTTLSGRNAGGNTGFVSLTKMF